MPLDGWGSFTQAEELTLDAVYVIQRCRVNDDNHSKSAVFAQGIDDSFARACLISNGYAAKFLSSSERYRFCDATHQFAAHVPVRRLVLPWGLPYLKTVCSGLDNDLDSSAKWESSP